MRYTAPEGYTSVAPWVVTDDTGALLDFITAAFGGEEIARVPVEDGTIGHGEIRVGDTVVPAFKQRSDWPVMPSRPTAPEPLSLSGLAVWSVAHRLGADPAVVPGTLLHDYAYEIDGVGVFDLIDRCGSRRCASPEPVSPRPAARAPSSAPRHPGP